MNDPTHAQRQVAGLAAVRDEDLTGIGSGPAARTLLTSIVAEPAEIVPLRRRTVSPVRRWAVGAAAVAAMTVSITVLPDLLGGGLGTATSYANSAIEVTRDGDYFVARIKDPLADHEEYVEAFHAVGKDVNITLVPVPPRLVGQRLEASGGSGVFYSEMVPAGPERVDCAVRPAACTLVIRISADTTGEVRYTVGRPAQPGEAYRVPARRPGR